MSNRKERPRLAERLVADGEIASQALDVAKADRPGVVDGVHVDFRHPDISPGQWEARAWWDVGADDEAHAGFLFPSEAEACEKKVERFDGDIAGDDLAQSKLALPRAEIGDRITVESVVDRISDRRFDHLHDAAVKLAYLILTRPTGEQVRPTSPLAFFGVTQLRDGPERDSYDRLADRILAEHGNADPHQYEISQGYHLADPRPASRDRSLSLRAGMAIEEAERAWLRLVTNHLQDDVRGQALLRQALNSAVLAAFYQAKHESKPAEYQAQRVIEGAEKGRKKAKAKDNRFQYARDIWPLEPTLTLAGIATQVIEQVYNAGAEMMSQSAMEESLRRAIDRGELEIPPESPSHPRKRVGSKP